MGTISLKATPINQDGNFRTFRQARGFLGFFAGEYPRHFYSTLTEPERDTGKARDQNVLFRMNFSMLGHLLIRRIHLADQLVVQLEWRSQVTVFTPQLRPGRRLAKVPLKDPLPAWQRIFERQKSQNGRRPISK